MTSKEEPWVTTGFVLAPPGWRACFVYQSVDAAEEERIVGWMTQVRDGKSRVVAGVEIDGEVFSIVEHRALPSFIGVYGPGDEGPSLADIMMVRQSYLEWLGEQGDE